MAKKKPVMKGMWDVWDTRSHPWTFICIIETDDIRNKKQAIKEAQEFTGLSEATVTACH